MTAPLDYLYSEPKWQARLVNERNFFVCQNGERIASLWELRQILANTSDDNLGAMVGENHNYIAPWVADTIGDSTLAAELQGRWNRWELLSALETHMVRSLALPSYLASRWLYGAQGVFVIDNINIGNLKEAVGYLDDENGILVQYLKNRKQDFADWVRYGIGDYVLADMIMEVENVEKLIVVIKDHVGMLEASQISQVHS